MPIGKKKKKTTLTDANRKKENSFNRCQSEKTNFTKISFQQNTTIKRFGFPIDATDCILRIRSWTFFRLRPFSNKMWATLFFREHFSFLAHSEIENTHAIKADWTFVIWTQRESAQRRKSTTTTRSDSDVEVTKSTSSYEKSKQWR